MLVRSIISVVVFFILLAITRQIGKWRPDLRGLVCTMPSMSLIILLQQSLAPEFDSLPTVFSYALGNIPAVFFYLGVYWGLKNKLNLNMSFVSGLALWGIVGGIQIVILNLIY